MFFLNHDVIIIAFEDIVFHFRVSRNQRDEFLADRISPPIDDRKIGPVSSKSRRKNTAGTDGIGEAIRPFEYPDSQSPVMHFQAHYGKIGFHSE